MSKKSKKKAVAKMKEVVKPYATMTEEQYDEIKSILTWENPVRELEDVASESNLSVTEIAFKMGKISKSFETMFEKLENILNEITPDPYESTPNYDWDSSEDDYEDTEDDEDEEDEEEEDEE
jgi:hypothetical protein